MMVTTAYVETLKRQNGAMRTLIRALEGELRILRERDYSYRAEKIRGLELALESEKEMNAILTGELNEALLS